MPEVEEGREFKNWLEFCETYNLPKQGGDTKKTMIEYLESCYVIDKRGHSFVFVRKKSELEIKENPKKEINNYLPYLRNSIIDYLFCVYKFMGKKKIYLTVSNLGEVLGLTNPDFRKNRHRIDILSSKIGIDRIIVSDFYTIVSDKMDNAIERALKNLQKMYSALSFKKVHVMCPLESNAGADDNLVELTEDQERAYLLAQQITLREDMNLYGIYQVGKLSLWDEYNKHIVNHLPEDLKDKKVFVTYRIIFTEKILEIRDEVYDPLLGDPDVKVNELFCKSHLEGAKTRKKEFDFYAETKEGEFTKEGLSRDTQKLIEKRETFVEDNTRLTKKLLRLKERLSYCPDEE